MSRAQINNEYLFIINYLCPMRLKDEQKIGLFLASTLTLVGQVGLVGLTMPLIAKQSGVATGTLYIYFKNKDDLIHALYKEIKKHFGATIFIGFSPELPVEEGLRVIWENSLRYVVSNFPEQVFLQQFIASPYKREDQAMAIARPVMAPLAGLLERGQREGLLKQDTESLIPSLLFGFVQQIAAHIHDKPARLTKAFMDTSFRLFWDAIRS
jgi:AcrR family transcriptional regulator